MSFHHKRSTRFSAGLVLFAFFLQRHSFQPLRHASLPGAVVTSLLFTAATIGFVNGHGDHDDGEFHNHTVTVCGTPDYSPMQMRRIMDISIKKKKRSQSHSVVQPSNITIDTYFCVVTDSVGSEDVSNSSLLQQIDVLNTNFANSGSQFRFELKGIKRFQQVNASNTILNNYVNRLGLSCHQGGVNALNIFVVPNIESHGAAVTLGITLPFFVYGVNYVDGVYIYRQTLPGMTFPRWDHGITCVHEVGHWLGLMHPFQALGVHESDPCNDANPQDYIADTPQMASASFGCPVGRDSCPNETGLDATNNFMDYSDDYDYTGTQCRTMFTAEQVARMQDVWYYYRVQNEICGIDELQFNLLIRFDNKPVETSWNLKLRNGTLVHSSTSDVFGETYSPYFAGQTININRCLASQRYVLSIYDSGGNGMSSPGYYQLTLNGHVVAQGGQEFRSSLSIRFGSTPQSPFANVTDDDNDNATVTVVVDVSSDSCFSASNTVEVENRGVISIKELRIGDMVKDAESTMVRVYSFGHYHKTVTTEYLQIHAKGILNPIEISRNHLLFVAGVPIPASRVSVGDSLNLGRGRGVAKVTKIKTVIRSGAYAPFTTSGTLMVNGVAVSSYVTLKEGCSHFMLGAYDTPFSIHRLAHIFQSVHRLACRWVTDCQLESYTEDGISEWVQPRLRMGKWLLHQNSKVMTVILIPALLIVLLSNAVELCCVHCYWVLLIVIAALAAIKRISLTCRTSKDKFS